MNELDELLMGKEPSKEIKKKQGELSELIITDYAYTKACMYAQIACKERKESIECGGYLLAKKNENNRIVTDVILANGQDVSSGTFEISGNFVIAAGKEIDSLGYKVLGWWHSHGELQTFFSSIDKQGQLTVLNGIAGTNYILKTKRQEIEELEYFYEPETNLITIIDKKNPERRYEFKQDGIIERPNLSNFTIVEEKKIGFSYGLVVNAKIHDPPYAEIAQRDFCSKCRKMHDTSFETNVNILTSQEDRFLDRKELENDIKKRVKFGNLLSILMGRTTFPNDPFTRKRPKLFDDEHFFSLAPASKKPKKPFDDDL